MYALITFLAMTIPLYCVYQLGSLAGLFSERSGVANVAIEGNMVVGAVVFSLLQQSLTPGLGEIGGFLTAILIAIPLSASFMLILAILTNRYMADHIISGTAMNILAPALMILIYILFSNQVDLSGGSPKWSGNIPPMVSQWVISIDINGVTNNSLNYVYILFLIITILILIFSTFILNKTKFGLRLKSSGENPYSLETAGVSVSKTRTHALYIAGILSSLAGIVFATMGVFSFTVKGSGFLAIGILILGKYKISGTIIGSLIIAVFIGIFNTLDVIKGTSDWNYIKESNLFKTIPYLLPLFGLAFLKTSYTPAAVGKNFKKDQR